MKMTSSKENLTEIKEISNSLKSLDENDKKIYSKKDLNNHLNEIQSALRDKERDLSLAAEIGQQLLEANTVLKKAYEELYIQNQDAQNKLQHYEQMTMTVHSGRSSPVQSSSSPLSPRYRAMRSRNNSPTPPRSRRGSRNLSLPPSVRLDGTGSSSPSSSLARSNDSATSDIEDISNSLKEQYIEKIQCLEDSLNRLERHNEELKQLLEKKKEEVNDIQIQNSKLLLIKDGEVYDLKQELETLMIKTKKLEMEKKSLTKENQRQANEIDRIETIDQEYIQDLLVKINRLDGSLRKMENTKEELEKNIENVMVEKLEYQNKCKTLDKKLQDYLYYKHLHDTQAQHIQELNQTIEQQRMQIQNLDFQLYNLSMSPDSGVTDIKYSEKYIMENPGSVESVQKSTTSMSSRTSYQTNDIESMYDPDTIVITARRNNGSSSIRASQSLPSSDPDLTLSSTGLGKRTLYSELESTDWYNKSDSKENDYYNDSNLIRSSSEGVINTRNKLLKSRNRQPYHHQYQSSYSLVGRKQSTSSSNDEALTLVDKANQSFVGNSNIEKIIKPQILKNDVNSYEVLINTIENEFKNSEEIQTNGTSSSNPEETEEKGKKNQSRGDSNNDDDRILDRLDSSEEKDNSKIEVDHNMDLSISSIEPEDSSKISYLADKNDNTVIDDTTIENNNQSSRFISNTNNNTSSSSSRTKLTFPSVSNPKTLALIKHSNIPLFDYKKLSNMIEKDRNLNPPNMNATQTNGMKRSMSDNLSQKSSSKLQNSLFQDHMGRFSFDSLFRAFELSKFRSNHLLTDANYSSNNKNRKDKKKGGSYQSIYTTDADGVKEKMNGGISALNPLNAVIASSVQIQEINDRDSDDEDTSAANTSSFFMPKTMNASIISNTMIPVNATSNKEFNSLIKNFHVASPITPLIANINLNNAIKEEASFTSTTISSSNQNPNNSSESLVNTPTPNNKKTKSRSKGKSVSSGSDTPKSMVSLKNKPLFGSPKNLLSQKMDLSLIYKESKDDTPTSTLHPNTTVSSTFFDSDVITKEEAESAAAASVTIENPNTNNGHSATGGANSNSDNDLINLLREKSNQGIEDPSGSYNSIFNSSVNGSSIFSSNVIMNNQVILDQYRNTLNHYSNSGSAIVQVLIDSWLRFLNGFVGYGSNVNYDINKMEYRNGAYRYAPHRSRSTFSDDSFATTDTSPPTSTNTSAAPSASSSTQNLKALSQTVRSKKL